MNSKRYWKPDVRIAELEELVVKVEQQRNTMTAERDKLTEENNRLHDARADDALFAEKKVEQAEAALGNAMTALRYGEEKDLPRLYEESQAALVERGRMLELVLSDLNEIGMLDAVSEAPWTDKTPPTIASVLADIRARAEEGSTP